MVSREGLAGRGREQVAQEQEVYEIIFTIIIYCYIYIVSITIIIALVIHIMI